MAKHQPYSRRELEDLRKAWFTERRGLVAWTVAVVFGVLVVVSVVLVALWGSSRPTWYVLGVTHAVLIAIGVHFWNSAFLANNRDSMRHLRGAWGEENTTMELETARRRRLIWGWVDGITLERGDIDHVVVTRRGGVVVIDSKWRNGTNDQDRLDMAAAAKKVQLRAEGVTRTLVSRERARHRTSGDAIRVRPIVVLWGAEQRQLPDGVATVDGIDFVAGRHLRKWLRGLDGDPVDKNAGAELVKCLLRYRAGVSESQSTTRA